MAGKPLRGAVTDARVRVWARALEALRSARSQMQERDERIRELERRLDRLEREAGRSVDLKVTTTALEGGLGNRPATDAYRNRQIAGFMASVNDLGLVSRKFGTEAARVAVQTGVRANLAMLYATAPASVEEGRRRDLLRVLFSSPAAAAILAGSEERHERFRHDVITAALNAGVETSTWELVRRSVEREEWATSSTDANR